jgi:hypothetical protein
MKQTFEQWKQEVMDTLSRFSMKSVGAGNSIVWDDWKKSYFDQGWTADEAITENAQALHCSE